MSTTAELEQILNCLREANAEGMLVDTIWMDDDQTLFDFIELCIEEAANAQQQEAVEKNQTRHTLYEDSDENIPEIIQDRNGQVALSMCKICGAAESELNDFSYCESYRKGQQQEVEPVAVIGDAFSILWIGRGPIAPIIERNGLKVGDKLYAHPPKPAAQPARCEYCDGSGDVHSFDGEWLGSCAECLPAAQPQDADFLVPEDTAHLIYYDDRDRPLEVFYGHGARDGARARYERISGNWNAHLFVCVDHNSLDDASSVPKAAQPIDADELSNFIRMIDGNHTMGAGALAENIVEWIGKQAAQPITMDGAIAAGDGTLHGAIDYWQQRALKAEAAQPQVPEGDLLRVIDERDEWEELATELAEAVGAYCGVDVGEHSSANCPVRNALEILGERNQASNEWDHQAYKSACDGLEYWKSRAEEAEKACVWRPEVDGEFWSGSCGAVWAFNDAGPKENNMCYCPNCGGKVVLNASKGE